MSKINNKVLLIVLVVLIGAYLANKYLGNQGERNFKSVIMQLDTSKVDRIVLSFPEKNNEITINKLALGEFNVTQNNITDEGDIGMIRSMLTSHVEMKPERLVANSSDKWAEYQVTDTSGVHVKMYAGSDMLSEIIVGKFDFQQATRTMSTMVRLANEDQVYAIDGFLSSTFNVEFDAVRDKTFLKAEKDAITSITAEYPADSSFQLSLQSGKWSINGQPADSAKSVAYSNGLIFLNLRDFVNDFDPSGMDPIYKLTLAGDSLNTIVVECYKPDDGQFVLHSTLNENSYFHPGVNNIFEKLFPPREKFIANPE